MPDKVSETIPEWFQQSDSIKDFLDTYESVLDSHVGNFPEKIVEQNNPQQFDFDLRDAFADLFNLDLPQYSGQTEAEQRDQLENAVAWIKRKGLEVSLKSFASQLNIELRVRPLLSNDYETFVTEDNIPPGGTGYQYTPHVLIDKIRKKTVNGELLTESLFNELTNRFEEIIPITTVPHYRFRIVGRAEEEGDVITHNEVEGVTTNNYQRVNSFQAGKCHTTDTNFVAKNTFEFMGTEAITYFKVGTLSGSPTKSTSSLDSVIFQSTDFEIFYEPQNDRTVIEATVTNDPNSGIDWNAIAFFNQYDEMVAVFKLPADTQLFKSDLLETLFEAQFLETPDNVVKARINEVQSTNTNNGVDTAIQTTNYDDTFNEDVRMKHPFLMDNGLFLDQEGKIPQLTEIQYGGYWKAGDLTGSSGSFPHLQGTNQLQNPLMDGCDDFEIYFQNSMEDLIVYIDLVKSSLFGESIEQIGLFNSNDELLVVSEFNPVSITDMQDWEAYRLNLEITQT